MSLEPGQTIGILGGGQLGRMLAMAAGRLGLKVLIFDPDANSPAAQLANKHMQASYDDEEALARFADECDIVTYEFENVPLDTARFVADRSPLRPGSTALEKSQDRLEEKTFIRSLDIGTAPFRAIDGLEDLIAAAKAMDGPSILKTRRLGYDGKGQARVDAGATDNALDEAWLAIDEKPAILEGFVPFLKEISIIAARSTDGRVVAFDPAENRHKDGILRTSVVPSVIETATATAAKEVAARILENLEYVGVIGVEFFVLEDGSVLVNEFAPRVHNSGHWTEAACQVSQFEQHIRAIAGWPLAAPIRHSDCEMVNLIGSEVDDWPAILEADDTVLHLYGKAETRSGRKMGHFTQLHPRQS